jgi:hypothetical protein
VHLPYQINERTRWVEIADYRRVVEIQKGEDRKLGVEMLLHMWPVVAKEHLIELKKTTECVSDSF